MNRDRQKTLAICWVFLITGGSALNTVATGQSSSDGLTIDQIFSSSDFRQEPTPQLKWLARSHGYTILVEASDRDSKSEGLDAKAMMGKEIVRVDPTTGKREVIVRAEELVPQGKQKPLAISDYSWSKDDNHLLIFTNTRKVWRRHTRGDYWSFDLKTRKLKQVGAEFEPAHLMFAKFSPDASQIAYVFKNNIYLEDRKTTQVRALTTDGHKTLINGTFDWAYEEEFGLRDGFRWSPDGQSIAFWQLDSTALKDFLLIDNTSELYPTTTSLQYPKVGEKNSNCRVGSVRLDSGEIVWAKIAGDPTNHYLVSLEWLKDSKTLCVQQMNRLQNTNRIFKVDARSGEAANFFTENDDAWIDHNGPLRWIENEERFVWISERSGWRQLLSISIRGDDVRSVTPATFDLISLLKVDDQEEWAYYLASPDNPTQKFLYRSRLDSSQTQRLTPGDQPGTHAYQISSDAKWALHSYSSHSQPPVSELVQLPGHQRQRVFADNKKLKAKVAQLNLPAVEFFRVDIGNGIELDSWCMKPRDFDPTKKYPLLVYVYGEPAAQTVLDRWGGRNYLWYSLLTQHGYIVMSFDNRGTPAPRGRDWRKIVYRQIGILAPQEQAAAVKRVLKTHPYIDPDRVGSWGWSGGGQMSLNAIFKFPKIYKMAMAVAFVSDQRLYDTIYQERFMGLPLENAKGFHDGSPINYAKNLEGNLLIVHGTGDDNVHYQSFERLVNELVLHNKIFTMMSYPNRTHSINEGKNTTVHLYNLLTRYLFENL